MKIKAIILDLDNTIFPVSSIGHMLFKPLFHLLEDEKALQDELENIEKDIMRKPFQKVAAQYSFGESLIQEGMALLRTLTVDFPITPFDDYHLVKELPVRRFLVTMGAVTMQQGKVDQMHLADDFEGIHIIDPETSSRTKKDVFQEILDLHQFQSTEILVVGDDPDSEIKAAMELGMHYVLFDKVEFNPHLTGLNRVTGFKEVVNYIMEHH